MECMGWGLLLAMAGGASDSCKFEAHTGRSPYCTLFLTLRQLATGPAGLGLAGLGWVGLAHRVSQATKLTGVRAGLVGEGLH
jgi:hypothetical protein